MLFKVATFKEKKFEGGLKHQICKTVTDTAPPKTVEQINRVSDQTDMK